MNITIDITDNLDAALDGIIKKIDRSKIAEAAGYALANMAKDSFEDESLRPKPWAPLKEATVRRKAREGKSENILKENLFLYKAIMAQNSGDGSVDVTAGVPYGVHHQFGTKNMPARPFMPFNPATGELTDAARQEIEEVANAEVKAMLQ